MNLILCYTPLQVLFAEEIIKKYPNDEFFGVMICNVANNKFNFYTKRLAQCCKNTLTIYETKNKFKRYTLEPLSLFLKFKNKQFDKVFLASIDTPISQLILSYIQFNTLFTFDDGIKNLIKSSYFYVEYKDIKRTILNILFRNKFNIERIKSISQKHYSIYKNCENIIDNVEYFQLTTKESNTQEVKNNKDTSISLFISQPIFADLGLGVNKDIQLINQIFEKFKIDLYVPHPREQFHLEHLTYVQTELIFEDYLKEIISNYNQITIYTCFSTAALNALMLYPNVNVILIKPEIVTSNVAYELFKPFNIPVVEI